MRANEARGKHQEVPKACADLYGTSTNTIGAEATDNIRREVFGRHE